MISFEERSIAKGRWFSVSSLILLTALLVSHVNKSLAEKILISYDFLVRQQSRPQLKGRLYF